MRFTLRGWLIYFAAWIPYALSYVAVFLAQNPNAAVLPEIRTALLNVVPAALCGVLVIKLCEKLSWEESRRAWFFPAHFFIALGFSLLWYAGVLLFLTVDLSLRAGRFSPVTFGGYALQWQLFSGLMIYGTIASVAYVLQIAANLRREKQRAAEAERLAAEANLAALRAQLNPHFLFNTLHSLMALVRYQPQAAEQALEQLAEMLRYVLREKADKAENSQLVRFADEWRFVEHYLALEKLRLGERLTIKSQIEAPSLDCRIPALTVQPLVENAVKHGVAPFSRRATVFISAYLTDGNLHLEVRNDGGGDRRTAMKTSGMGLRLVREQLQIHYGAQAALTVDTGTGKGFAVKIRLPARIAGNKDATLLLENQTADDSPVAEKRFEEAISR